MRTSRESQQERQSWSQDKVHRGRQSRRWSPTRSSLGISRTLESKEIFLHFNLELQLTVYSRGSEEDVHDGNVSLIGIVEGFTLKSSFYVTSRYDLFLPVWGMLWAPCHPSSLGTSSSLVLLSCRHKLWTDFHISRERFVATLPEMLNSGSKKDSDSDSVNRMDWKVGL